MPIFKNKNENFFEHWSSEMAYILGFFCADGSMVINPRGSHYIEFQNTELGLLERIRNSFESNHKITKRIRNENWKPSYRLQIGSKKLYDDLINLGLVPKKNKRLKLPAVPTKYLPHFTRGYFDGDGNVTICTYKRKTRNNKLTTILRSGFTSGSKNFLSNLKNKLLEIGIIKGGTLYYSSNGWRLFFAINDSKNLYQYMYKGFGKNNRLFLERKKIIFEKYLGA